MGSGERYGMRSRATDGLWLWWWRSEVDQNDARFSDYYVALPDAGNKGANLRESSQEVGPKGKPILTKPSRNKSDEHRHPPSYCSQSQPRRRQLDDTLSCCRARARHPVILMY